MDSEKHTPLPWVQSGSSIHYRLACGLTEKLAHISGGEFGKPNPNAAFIVTACNLHYELLGALKAVSAALNQPVQFTELRKPQHELIGQVNILRGDAAVAKRIADAAIAKAVGAAA